MRRNVYTLTDGEWNAFVGALNAVKAAGIYDEFTRRHQNAMLTLTLFPGETGTRNVAHVGPAFFPWHRVMVRELEVHLQDVDPSVWVPYWPWEQEGAAWTSSSLWSPQRMGGDGGGQAITDGPFAGWTSIMYSNGTFVNRAGIRRNFNGAMPVWEGMGNDLYDVDPWNNLSNRQVSFRNAFERVHNQVHTGIGGDMTAGTSPNDPIFYLHHANVDRAWAHWQTDFGIANFQPLDEAPEGHNADDILLFAEATGIRISDTFDWRVMGYTYDTLARSPIAATPATVEG